jgi:hypothetical protein
MTPCRLSLVRLLALALLAGSAFAQALAVRLALPDHRLTPGATVPGVSVSQVCIVGYSRTVRDVPITLKREVYRRYGLVYVKGTREVDHLIPLSIGGSNAIENLWPEDFAGEWNARVKDDLEYRLHNMVCRGELSLQDAQRMIAANWIEAYKVLAARPRRRR